MVLTDEDGIDAIKSRRINRNPARRSCCKKSLKIPKGQSESVYRRRTTSNKTCI